MTLCCPDGGGAVDAVANDVKIAALEVASLTTGWDPHLPERFRA